MKKYIISACACCFFIACAQQKPHPKQYLLNRHFISSYGMQQYIELYDIAQDNPVKAIHLGSKEDTIVKNYMLYNPDHNLKEINGIIEGESDFLMTFRYDNKKILRSIKYNKDLLPLLDFDSIIFAYKKDMPKEVKLIKHSRVYKTINILFDDNTQEYVFASQANDKKGKTFDIYLLKGNNIMAEYHKTMSSGNKVDSVKYYYTNNQLVRKIAYLQNKILLKTEYNDAKPIVSTATDKTKNSIIWTDKYEYNIDGKFPLSISTTSSLGWNQYIDYIIEE